MLEHLAKRGIWHGCIWECCAFGNVLHFSMGAFWHCVHFGMCAFWHDFKSFAFECVHLACVLSGTIAFKHVLHGYILAGMHFGCFAIKHVFI